MWLHSAVIDLISVCPYREWVQRTLLWMRNLLLRECQQLVQSLKVREIGT